MGREDPRDGHTVARQPISAEGCMENLTPNYCFGIQQLGCLAEED